jgi:hypothetical protein
MLDSAFGFSVRIGTEDLPRMEQIIIGIHAKLTKDGEKDIDLLVHSHYIGCPSPCVVITDWSTQSDIGDSNNSLGQIFDDEVAKHPGYTIKERVNLVAITDPQSLTTAVQATCGQIPSVSPFKFLDQQGSEIPPGVWMDLWAARYGEDGDNDVYFDLIEKQGALSGDDFELMGKWKERCLKPANHGSWKTGTPRAYDVWMQAKAELPKCPEEDGVANFLRDWSDRTFAAGKEKPYRFGLSRSTTLLHFISSGRYPILDSNVDSAMTRLGSPLDICGYLHCFCPLFSKIASACGVSGTEGLRKLDNALFMYGSEV